MTKLFAMCVCMPTACNTETFISCCVTFFVCLCLLHFIVLIIICFDVLAGEQLKNDSNHKCLHYHNGVNDLQAITANEGKIYDRKKCDIWGDSSTVKKSPLSVSCSDPSKILHIGQKSKIKCGITNWRAQLCSPQSTTDISCLLPGSQSTL